MTIIHCLTKSNNLQRNWLILRICLLLLLYLNRCTSTVKAQQNSANILDDIDIEITPNENSINFSLLSSEYRLESVNCERAKNVKQSTGNGISCENLEPCTLYSAHLLVKVLKDDTTQKVEKQVRTLYKEPTVEIESISEFTDALNITWSATDTACIHTFLVQVTSTDKDYVASVQSDYRHVYVSNLHPCQQYNILLAIEDVNKHLLSNQTTSAITSYSEPGNLNLNLSIHEHTQMKVSWRLPENATCIRFYYIRWYMKNCDIEKRKANDGQIIDLEKCEWNANLTTETNANVNEYIITDLHGCEDYYVEIYVNLDNNLKANETFNSPEQVPSAVDLNYIQTDTTTVTMRWTKPTLHSKCVKVYHIDIVGPLQRSQELQHKIEQVTERNSVSFTNLDPCGRYNVTVLPVTASNTKSTSTNSTFELKEGKPNKVQDCKVSSEPHSIKISWSPPIFADLCLINYHLSAWNDDHKPVTAFNVITPNTSATITGLNSCQAFTVQIVPVTKTIDGEAVEIETETATMIPQAPTLETIGSYPNYLIFSAKESDLDNKCETIFAHFVCEARVDVTIKIAEKYVEGQMGIIYNAAIGPLSPYTEYICSVSLFNIAGWSPTKTAIKRTEPYYPNAPKAVELKLRTNQTLFFNWLPPKFQNGNIKLYIIYFQFVEQDYFISEICKPISSEPIRRETSSLEQSFDDLFASSKYNIQVAALNEFGLGEYSKPYIVITKPWISDPITNLTAVPLGPADTYEKYKANVTLTWYAPCKSNGNIEYFILEFAGIRKNYADVNFMRRVMMNFSKPGYFVFEETNLKSEYNYTVSVSVKTREVNELSAFVKVNFESPPGIPQRVSSDIIAKSRVQANDNTNPARTALVRFPSNILKSESGTINYMAILLSQKNCKNKTILKYGTMDTDIQWPDVASWIQANNNNYDTACVTQYQTTPLRWKPNTTKYRSMGEISFAIGTEDCASSTTNHYCNGPLKPDTEYDLVLRLFTKSGYNDVAILEFRTEALIELTLIIVGVSSSLLLALIGGYVYIWITKRIEWQRESYHGVEDSFGDIISKKFALYYKEISKKEKLAREFKELTMVALDLSYDASEKCCNKNQQADIYPYDKNRVILDIDAEGSDYINASFIDGYKRRKEYIATQAPKPESVKDFWRMVLQHNVRLIIALPELHENDSTKSNDYLPFKYKGINVIVKKSETYELYDRMELSVTHQTFGLKQKVIHCAFKKWIDPCLTDPQHLISFVRKVKAERIPNYSPIVVHCSAGVGRTGTIIALDIVMQRLKNESKINIYETVKKLRFQRMKMVQTLQQYTFLYHCTYELVKHKINNSPKLKIKHLQPADVEISNANVGNPTISSIE